MGLIIPIPFPVFLAIGAAVLVGFFGYFLWALVRGDRAALMKVWIAARPILLFAVAITAIGLVLWWLG